MGLREPNANPGFFPAKGTPIADGSLTPQNTTLSPKIPAAAHAMDQCPWYGEGRRKSVIPTHEAMSSFTTDTALDGNAVSEPS